MTWFEFARWSHIAGGSLALATFWIPWAVRKGGGLHRRAGWLYVASMALVCVSGIAVSTMRLFDPQPRNDPFAWFLNYVALMAFANGWVGLRALRTKSRTGRHLGAGDLAVSSVFAATGIAVIALAASVGSVLFAIFGLLGVASGGSQLAFWLRPPQSRIAWLIEHLTGMGAACIGTITAFVVVNTQWLGLGRLSLVAWIAPGVLGAIAISAWSAYYRRKASGVTPASLPLTQRTAPQ